MAIARCSTLARIVVAVTVAVAVVVVLAAVTAAVMNGPGRGSMDGNCCIFFCGRVRVSGGHYIAVHAIIDDTFSTVRGVNHANATSIIANILALLGFRGLIR
jgi:hypothetical protein